MSLRGGSFSLGRRRSGAAGRSGLLGTAAGEDLGLKDLPDRNDVAEVLSGGANFGDEGEHLLDLQATAMWLYRRCNVKESLGKGAVWRGQLWRLHRQR